MSGIDLTGIQFVITGKGEFIIREHLIQQIKFAGGSIHQAVGAGTSFLLTGKSNRTQPTKKLKDADTFGVTKVDIDDFVEWMRDPGNTSLRAASASISAINRRRDANSRPPDKKVTKPAAKAAIKKLYKGLASVEMPSISQIDF